MLIFIENTPRSYAWGSKDAIPEMLGVAPTGEPQAELWLGAHPGSPAHVAKATNAQRTLIDLIESDPERWGVDGGPLPFLLKVLAIEAPLSLQVHPDRDQAFAGFAAEERAGVPRESRERNYGDTNHKPELLVALTEVRALCGFRPLAEVRHDVARLSAAALAAGDEPGAAALAAVGDQLVGDDPEPVRLEFLRWVFTGDPSVAAALRALGGLAEVSRGRTPQARAEAAADWDPDRVAALQALIASHPSDPGVLVSLLLHVVRLAPGEAIFLGPRQLHAYLDGVAVEVMAASDNVLRAGLTEKHVDVAELTRIVDPSEIESPRQPCERLAPGLVAWRPGVPDFQLLRARLCDPDRDETVGSGLDEAAEQVTIEARRPLVLVVVQGKVEIDRPRAAPAEYAKAKRGQSVYVSAGEPIELRGRGEVFLATVGG